MTHALKGGMAADELSKGYLPTEFVEPLVTYLEANPIMAALYLTMLLVIVTLAAYKCKFYRRFCTRRRNRRRRKPRSHYYYLNQSGAENAENNQVADPLIAAAGDEVQLSGTRSKK